MELQVLGACLKSRQTNDLVTEHLNDKDFSKEYQTIRGLIKEYYDRDREASRVDPQLLSGIIENSVQNKKHRERFMDMVEQAAGIDVSSANMDELILKGKLTAIGMRLATALVNGDNSVDELYEEYGQIKGMESLDDLTGKGVEVLTIDDMQSVVEAAADGSNLLKVYPLSLNAKLNGGLGGGHHLVTFARPECLDGGTTVAVRSNPRSRSATKMTIAALYRRFHGNHWLRGNGPYMIQSTKDGKVFYNEVMDVLHSGNKECFRVTTEDGRWVVASADHVMLTSEGDKPLSSVVVGDSLVTEATAIRRPLIRKELTTKLPYSNYRTRMIAGHVYHRVLEHRLVYDAGLNGYDRASFVNRLKNGGDDDLVFSSNDMDIHHLDGDHNNNTFSNLTLISREEHIAIHAAAGDCGNGHRSTYSKVVSIEPVGIRDCYDIRMSDTANNFKVNGGLFVHNCGKTAFNLTIACGFASQGAPGIYFLNEDRLEDVYLRGLCCITGQPENVIKSDLNKWGEIARDMGFGNIMFVSLAPGTLADIDRFCEKYKPRWIVVDQLRNLQMKETNKVLQLEYATTGIRNIAKKHNLIAVSTTQAGDSAEGKRLLDMGDVDFSNCLAKGTEVLMYDGSKRAIEHIRVGEQVMGMDGTPRNVLATGNGSQPLYKITHKNGDSYTVNQQHIMVVKNSDNRTNVGIPNKSVGDIPLQTLLDRPALLTKLKGIWFAGREFDHADLPIDPYLFGLWLADGFSHTLSISTSDSQLRDYLCTKFAHLTPAVRVVNVYNSIVAFNKQANGYPNPLNDVLRKLGVLRNKHIPEIYLRASKAQRLALLAGVIDGDGSMRRTKPSASDCYTIYSGNNDKLAEDTVELCKSLGFYTCKTRSHPTCWAIRISGKVTSIPCVLDRKKATRDSQIDYLASNMRIEKVADDGEFFGITVDRDERYVLGNYIVTHNTGVAAQADVLVGVGATREDAEQGVRYLAVSKNKRGGGHAQIPVKINTSISRYMPYT